MKIAYQGVAGAYSNIAAENIYPGAEYCPSSTFDEAFSLVQEGLADAAVIPVENSKAGRVSDVHFLLPETGFHIQGEYFLPVHHQLLGLKGTSTQEIKTAVSHPQALAQCAKYLKENKIAPEAGTDTAKSCLDILNLQDRTKAAIASEKAAQIYGLEILAPDIETDASNTTRFLIMGRQEQIPEDDGRNFITSLIFRAKNIPAALYKALGGFATNGINLTKLESYLLNGKFVSAQFYAEIESHPRRKSFQNALGELEFFSESLHILGTYAAHPFRYK